VRLGCRNDPSALHLTWRCLIVAYGSQPAISVWPSATQTRPGQLGVTGRNTASRFLRERVRQWVLC
jgi:hypothetical protein